MAWIRRNNTYYYYRSKKRDGLVVQEYVGPGVIGALAWAEDERGREARRAEAGAWRSERSELERGDREISGISGAIEAAVLGALEASGFHKHARGRWRRRRTMGGSVAMDAGPRPLSEVVTREELSSLFRRATEGDATCLPRIRELARLEPVRVVHAMGGDLAFQVECAIIDRMSGPVNLLWKEALPRKAENLRRELGIEAASTVERLAIERVVLCYLASHAADLRAEHAGKEGAEGRRLEYIRRARDSEHRRYLSSLRALAAIRRLDLSLVQVNIDKVNVEAAGPDAAGVIDVPGA